MKLIKQHDERDCAAACLAMIADYYGIRLPFSRFIELTKTDKSGANLYGILDAASSLGLQAEALEGNEGDLEEAISSGDVQFPFVAHTVTDSAMLHFVVLDRQKGDRYHICDPGKGKIWMSKEDFYRCWTGYIASFQKGKTFKVPKEKRETGLMRFFTLLRGQYRRLAWVLVMSLIISGIGIASAYVFQTVIDGITRNEIVKGNILQQLAGLVGNGSQNIRKVFLFVIALYVIQFIIQIIRGKLIALTARDIDLSLSLSYYNHLVNLPISSISIRQTGEYLSRFSDTAAIRNAISNATITLLLDTVMVAACGFMLFLQNRTMFLVSLSVVIIYGFVVAFYRNPLKRQTQRVMEDHASVQSLVKESLDGIETIKAANAENEIINKTGSRIHTFVEDEMKGSMIAVTQDAIVDTIELIGTILILWIGFSFVNKGVISLGSLMTYYVLLGYYLSPIKNLIELQPTIGTAIVAAERLSDILDLTEENLSQGTDGALDAGNWSLKDVRFRYGNRELVLDGIDLDIKKGEKIAIVGESGSGKTTLAKLMMKFYKPETGRIEVDGHELQDIDTFSFRKRIAYVDQTTFLFADTIRNNLMLGNPDVTEDDMIEACRKSMAHDFIMKLPSGYDTPLDENGMNLSGGQRQRLSIARALLRKPQLLILDEATSNLDANTETGIKNALFAEGRDLTCIIIAHRLSTIKKCDRILVIENGKAAEQGSHEELLKENGIDARLGERQ